jgi:flagellar hook-length control protein FliK
VTVRAHVAEGSLRVELFAPTTVARDALSAMLPDLRRDLAAAGSAATTPGSTSLDLGSGNPPSDGGAGARAFAGGSSGSGAGSGTPQRWQPARVDDLTGRGGATAAPSRPRSGGTSLLDVLA